VNNITKKNKLYFSSKPLLLLAFSNIKATKLCLIIFTFLLSIFGLNAKAQSNNDFEDISILVQIEGVNNSYNVAALYSPEGKLYIAVDELFQVLIIPCLINKDGDIVRGFVENDKKNYEINYLKKEIKIDSKVHNCGNELIKNMGMIYLESSLYGKIFGLNLTFNFRSLSVKVKSDFELPIIKKNRLEKIRSTIQKNSEEEQTFDKTIKRNYHLFGLGTIDWSAMSSQTNKNQIDSRFGLNLGTELLFGEANLYLNFSDKSKPDPRQQQFQWRWVDNDKTIIRQIQAGNISNRSISSLNAPVHGAIITNTPTSIRKAKGEYVISDVTQPDWLVELYINNSLVDYTKADAAGQFTFKVPIVYGYTVLKLKFYGPMGEERTEERIMNVPNNFMPSGVFEYKIGGGLMQDNNERYFGRGEGNFGLTRNITIGGGVEYINLNNNSTSNSSVNNNLTSIPFANISILPFRRLILSGEYAHDVKIKGMLNYYLWSNAVFEIDYSKYKEGQKVILFNYLEERKAGLSFPLRLKNISGTTRISFKQNVYKNFTYNMADLLFSAFYRQFNANISTYANWIEENSVYVNTNAAISMRLPKGFSFRNSAQISITNSELISFKTEIEKKISRSGYFAASFERNIVSNYSSFNISLKFDFSFAQTNVSTRFINNDVSFMESVRGGIAYDSKNNRIFANQQSMVGRGGISFIPFIDINHNGVFDANEKKAYGLSVKINGGRPVLSEKDSIIRIMGLEPFIYYNVELEDKNFEFITWRLTDKKYKILVDPNQFKSIEIPVSPVAEISGIVQFQKDSLKEGIGRVIVNIYNKYGTYVNKTITESDGYFNHIGLLPGEYFVKIDSVQLNRLQMAATPSQINITVKPETEGDVIDNLDFVLNKKEIEKQKTDTIKDIITNDTIITKDIVSKDITTKDTSTTKDKTRKDFITKKDKIAKKTIKEIIATKAIVVTKEESTFIWGDICLKDGYYHVQCGAFKNKNNAMRMALNIKNTTDLSVGIILNDGLYKVRVGCSPKRKDADNIKLKLIEKGGFDKIFILVNKGIADTTNISLQNAKINVPSQNEELNWDNICTKSGYYYIQYRALKHKENAMKLALNIKRKTNFDVGILINNEFYRVQVGCLATKKEAEIIKHTLIEKIGDKNIYIMSNKEDKDSISPALQNKIITIDTNFKESYSEQNDVLIWGVACDQIGYYYIQFGAFKHKVNAMKLAQNIKNTSEFDVGIILNNGLYKVQVGCESTKKNAIEIKRTLLEKRGGNNVFIMINKGKKDNPKTILQKNIINSNKNKTSTKSNQNYELIWGNICSYNDYYTLQCGAFKNKDNAIKMALNIKQNSIFDVGVVLSDGLYKVKVGCSSDRNEIEANKQNLIDKGIGNKENIIIIN